MGCNDFTILFFPLFITYFIDQVSGLPMENIVNGLNARQEDFKYQTAVLGRYNFSNVYYFQCGGGIVSPNVVLSVAHCFVNESGILHNMSFTIAAGTDNLNLNEGIRDNVDIIYFPPYTDHILDNDIAALKLKKGWTLDGNSVLIKLYLPTANETVGRRAAVVAGFGFNTVKTAIDKDSGKPIRIDGKSDYSLKFGHINIVTDSLCRTYYPNANISAYICGLMVANPPKRLAGTCSGDSGSPLVYQMKVVGIASRSSVNCDDTERGARYTRVSAFLNFIENILTDTPTSDTIAFMNRPHISRLPAT